MIAELTMISSMGYREIMQTPMLVFGMLYRHAKKIKDDDHNRLLMDLCDVVGVAYGGPKYQDAIRGHYRAKLMDEKQKAKALHPRRFDAEDKEQGRQAARILAAAFKQKARLMGM